MNKPPSDYDNKKQLIETQNNNIANVQNSINRKSKVNVQMNTHSKTNRTKNIETAVKLRYPFWTASCRSKCNDILYICAW